MTILPNTGIGAFGPPKTLAQAAVAGRPARPKTGRNGLKMLGFCRVVPHNPARRPAHKRLIRFSPHQAQRCRVGVRTQFTRAATTVPHITLSKKTNCNPSLEYYSDGSNEVRRVTIEKNPFKIGRADSTDLRIESAEVSRERRRTASAGCRLH